MAVVLGKFYMDELHHELHSMRLYKFVILDQIRLCITCCDQLSDALFVMRSPIRVRVRELLMQNCEIMRCLKSIFRILNEGIVEIKEKVQAVKRWIEHQERLSCI